MSSSLEVGGLDQLDRLASRYRRAGAGLHATVVAARRRKADALVRQMASATPRRTGATADAWHATPTADGATVENGTVAAAVLITGATYPSRHNYHRPANPRTKAAWEQAKADAADVRDAAAAVLDLVRHA